MAKERYARKRFRDETLLIVGMINDVVEEYMAQGLTLTLRQLYYVFIARDLFPATWIDREYNHKYGLEPDTKNTEKNYKRLGGALNNARLAGRVDWDAIEDRGRRPYSPTEFDNLADLIRGAERSYRLERWRGQGAYAELWVEKDALAGVLHPLAMEHHVTLMVNRGYSSQSAMYASAQRFLGHTRRANVLFYLGDFDPSGEDMVRDIGERLRMFGVEDLDLRKIALTKPQIRQHKPPPNPAKLNDPRAGIDKHGQIIPGGYVDLHGLQSWEVDALRPELLSDLVRSAFATIIDDDLMDKIKSQEERDKKKFMKTCKPLMKVK